MGGTDTVIRYMAGGVEQRCVVDRLAICRIGRGSQNLIVLEDRAASREHAMVRRNASGECIVTDLGSTNGTRLNGRLLTAPTALADGDVLTIGAQKLDFQQSVAPILPTDLQVTPATMFYIEQSLITIIVVDVRGYTPLARQLGEERVSQLMSDIFKHAGAALHARQCWTTKFIGDAIMAVWLHADNRLRPGDLINVFDVISEFAAIFAASRKKFGLDQPLRFGVGINTGQASIGNLGSATSADFTALGDTVNKAFRLESATRQVDCDILLGADVLAHLDADLSAFAGDLRTTELKGYDHPVHALPLSFGELGTITSALFAAHDSGRTRV